MLLQFKHEKLSAKVETKPKATKQNKVKAGFVAFPLLTNRQQ